MAVKPWLGAIKKPEGTADGPLKEDRSIPDVGYKFDFVHGFKSDNTFNNCMYNVAMEPTYMTAALGVVFERGARTQKIFGGGEDLPKGCK
jgi:hypothetical protein